MTMRCLHLLVFLLLDLRALSAQEDSAYFDIPLQALPERHTTLVFGNRINVRQAPTRQAAQVGQLYGGDAVTVLAADSTRMMVNGWTAHWHKVAFTHDDRRKEGYVWGGLLSPVGLQTGDICFVYNVIKSQTVRHTVPGTEETREELRQEIEFRALRHGDVLASVRAQLPIQSNYRTRARLYDHLGLKSFRNALRFEFFDPATCGHTAYQVWCLWDGRQLLLLPVLETLIDTGAVRQAESYLFPDSPGGVPGQLVYQREVGQGAESDGTQDYRRQRRPMLWNGKTYVKPKLEERP